MPNRALPSELFVSFRAQIQAIVPPVFLQEMELNAMRDAMRYLRGLRIRVERAHSSTAKDAAKAALVRPYQERLSALDLNFLQSGGPGATERRRLYSEYRQMVEEYTLSLFAQEIKTAFPISTKRLDEKWRNLEQAFINL